MLRILPRARARFKVITHKLKTLCRIIKSPGSFTAMKQMALAPSGQTKAHEEPDKALALLIIRLLNHPDLCFARPVATMPPKR